MLLIVIELHIIYHRNMWTKYKKLKKQSLQNAIFASLPKLLTMTVSTVLTIAILLR